MSVTKINEKKCYRDYVGSLIDKGSIYFNKNNDPERKVQKENTKITYTSLSERLIEVRDCITLEKDDHDFDFISEIIKKKNSAR